MKQASIKTEYEDCMLDGQDFSGMALIGVSFKRCSLRRCDFSNCDLSYSVFEECDLYEVNFAGACLYVSRIHDCDATKAKISKAYLHGFRIRNTDITHVEIGNDFLVGKNRKRKTEYQPISNGLEVRFGEKIQNIEIIESKNSGIYCKETGISIEFIDEQKDEKWRRYRRQSEVAKNLERSLDDNGYKDKILDLYYLKRKLMTRSERGIFKKRYLLAQEFLWGYGVRLYKPVRAAILFTFLFSFVYVLLAVFTNGHGLTVAGAELEVVQRCGLDWGALGNTVLFAIQVSTLSVYSDTTPAGFSAFVSAVHSVFSVAIIGMIIASLTRRIGNI